MIWRYANLLVDIHYTEICRDSHKIAVKLGARKGHEEPQMGSAESAFQCLARAEKSEISTKGGSNSSFAEGSRGQVENDPRDRHGKGPDTGCLFFPTMFHETC